MMDGKATEKDRQTHTIRIGDSARSFACRPDQSLLQAMREAGQTGLPIGCRNGGCGVCRVQVKAGDYETRQMSAACVDARAAGEGLALACRIYPRSDMAVIAAPRRCARDHTALAA